jgi:HD-GYP domain-containing protein (c-di-GMP phosphodiesterase class II)
MGRMQAVNEIKKNAGTQFDPELVEVFLSSINREDSNRESDKSNDKPSDSSIKKVS